MAKTKLLENVKSAVNRHADSIGEILADIHQTVAGNANGISQEHKNQYLAAYSDSRAAFDAALKHADDLTRRMGDEKTMTDRLRNLKNIFQDANKLKQARTTYRTDLKQLYDSYLQTQEAYEKYVDSLLSGRG